MSPIVAFTAFYEKTSGEELPASVRQDFTGLLDMVGGQDGFPAYLVEVLDSLARGEATPWREVPAGEGGYAWLLGEVSQLVPDTEYRNDPGVDVFLSRPLKMKMTLRRSERESYRVERTAAAGAAPAANDGLEYLNTYDPSPAQIREWAYRPDLRFAEQDESAAVAQPRHLPLLLQLAADPDGPKRDYLLRLLDGMVVNISAGPVDRELLQSTLNELQSLNSPFLRDWQQDLQWVMQYLAGQGRVAPTEARRLARIVQTGRYRPSLQLTERHDGESYQYLTTHESFPDPLDRLYVNARTGYAVWSKQPLTEAELRDLYPSTPTRNIITPNQFA